MTTTDEANPRELVLSLAENLKELPEVKAPVWAKFVKTGRFKERPPMSNDWWHIRAAGILRTVYRLGPIGTSKLRTKYGGKKNRGVASEHAYKGSGSIVRKILQQLEKAGLIVQASKGVHKGRIISPKGKSFLNKVAKGIEKKEQPKPAKTEAKPEATKKTKEKKKQNAQ
ncbi:30S ribosomal protein S19e [Candidatus Woesearchaeota archaeon]|nr:30S ribosomal protein S19e [Candidatus Woesearchaeota archaeon]